MGLALVTAPADLLDLAEVQLHLRSENPEEEDRLAALARQATALAENYCRRRFVAQTWRLRVDAFPEDGRFVLPGPPLVSVASVKYLDGDGDEQTVSSSDYVVDADETPGVVRPAYGLSWPTARSEPNAVRVQYVCGYGDPDDVPDGIKQAVLAAVRDLYDNPEVGLSAHVRAALGPYVVRRF